MARKKKVGKKEEVVEATPESLSASNTTDSSLSVLPSEKEQVLARRGELFAHREWMVLNRLQDIGQVEVALAKANQRLSEL